jgi:hypothetical protein
LQIVADYTRSAGGEIQGKKKPARPRRLVQEMSTKSVPNKSPINTSGILIVALTRAYRQREKARE